MAIPTPTQKPARFQALRRRASIQQQSLLDDYLARIKGADPSFGYLADGKPHDTAGHYKASADQHQSGTSVEVNRRSDPRKISMGSPFPSMLAPTIKNHDKFHDMLEEKALAAEGAGNQALATRYRLQSELDRASRAVAANESGWQNSKSPDDYVLRGQPIPADIDPHKLELFNRREQVAAAIKQLDARVLTEKRDLEIRLSQAPNVAQAPQVEQASPVRTPGGTAARKDLSVTIDGKTITGGNGARADYAAIREALGNRETSAERRAAGRLGEVEIASDNKQLRALAARAAVDHGLQDISAPRGSTPAQLREMRTEATTAAQNPEHGMPGKGVPERYAATAAPAEAAGKPNETTDTRTSEGTGSSAKPAPLRRGSFFQQDPQDVSPDAVDASSVAPTAPVAPVAPASPAASASETPAASGREVDNVQSKAPVAQGQVVPEAVQTSAAAAVKSEALPIDGYRAEVAQDRVKYFQAKDDAHTLTSHAKGVRVEQGHHGDYETVKAGMDLAAKRFGAVQVNTNPKWSPEQASQFRMMAAKAAVELGIADLVVSKAQDFKAELEQAKKEHAEQQAKEQVPEQGQEQSEQDLADKQANRVQSPEAAHNLALDEDHDRDAHAAAIVEDHARDASKKAVDLDATRGLEPRHDSAATTPTAQEEARDVSVDKDHVKSKDSEPVQGLDVPGPDQQPAEEELAVSETQALAADSALEQGKEQDRQQAQEQADASAARAAEKAADQAAEKAAEQAAEKAAVVAQQKEEARQQEKAHEDAALIVGAAVGLPGVGVAQDAVEEERKQEREHEQELDARDQVEQKDLAKEAAPEQGELDAKQYAEQEQKALVNAKAKDVEQQDRTNEVAPEQGNLESTQYLEQEQKALADAKAKDVEPTQSQAVQEPAKEVALDQPAPAQQATNEQALEDQAPKAPTEEVDRTKAPELANEGPDNEAAKKPDEELDQAKPQEQAVANEQQQAKPGLSPEMAARLEQINARTNAKPEPTQAQTQEQEQSKTVDAEQDQAKAPAAEQGQTAAVDNAPEPVQANEPVAEQTNLALSSEQESRLEAINTRTNTPDSTPTPTYSQDRDEDEELAR